MVDKDREEREKHTDTQRKTFKKEYLVLQMKRNFM